MFPKLYVAGAWPNREAVRAKIDELKQRGFTITRDWTRYESENAFGHAVLAVDRNADKKAVKECDVLVVTFDYANVTYPCRETWTEFGIATGDNKPILVFDPDKGRSYSSTNAFYHIDGVTVLDSWEAVVSQLEKMKAAVQPKCYTMPVQHLSRREDIRVPLEVVHKWIEKRALCGLPVVWECEDQLTCGTTTDVSFDEGTGCLVVTFTVDTTKSLGRFARMYLERVEGIKAGLNYYANSASTAAEKFVPKSFTLTQFPYDLE